MTDVEVFVDPSCPWAWITSRWLVEVAPPRDLSLTWRSYCLEIRDDYGVAPTMPEEYRERALAGHALSHRMLRIFEAARAAGGEGAVDALYTEWGRRYFLGDGGGGAGGAAAAAAAMRSWPGVSPGAASSRIFFGAADDEKWDTPIVDAMEVAYQFGGPKTQTPTIVVRAPTPYGFKGPVMAPAPHGRGRHPPMGRHHASSPGSPASSRSPGPGPIPHGPRPSTESPGPAGRPEPARRRSAGGSEVPLQLVGVVAPQVVPVRHQPLGESRRTRRRPLRVGQPGRHGLVLVAGEQDVVEGQADQTREEGYRHTRHVHDAGVTADHVPDRSDQFDEGGPLGAHGISDAVVALGSPATQSCARSSMWMPRIR